MLYFVFITILSVAAATTPLQGSFLAPASQFAGHHDPQSPTAAQDALHRLLNRQVTCDPGYGLCSNGRCCPSTDSCCSNSDLCVQVGGYCCSDNQHTCPPGWDCCGAYCSPVGSQCCATGYYCPNGWWCVLYSGAQYCCYGLACLGTYNPQYLAAPTITGNNLLAPTNAAGGSGTNAPAPTSSSTTEPPSAPTAVVYMDYYFTITWSYESYYYTGTAEWEYASQLKYDSTTVSFYCSDYQDASYSADMYSMTENFPTPTNAALPSFTNSVAAATTSANAGGGSGGSSSSSSGAPSTGASGLWQGCTSSYVKWFVVSCFLVNLVL
jgi:hypothetical protein